MGEYECNHNLWGVVFLGGCDAVKTASWWRDEDRQVAFELIN